MSTTDYELLDVVNASDEVIGCRTRREIHEQKLLHRAVHVFLFNPDGQLYLQKRSHTKDTFPDCWDSSASGHLNSNEDYDACAIREVNEEIGLTGLHLTRLFKLDACPETGWEFVWVYSAISHIPPVPNPQEISEGRFFTMAEVCALIDENPRNCAHSFIKIFDHFIRNLGH